MTRHVLGCLLIMLCIRAADSAALELNTIQRDWEQQSENLTQHFVIRTNLPERAKAAIVEEADELWAQTEQVLGEILSLSPRESHRTRLSVFATFEEYRAYRRAMAMSVSAPLPDVFTDTTHGFHSNMRNEIMLACPEGQCRDVLAHEFSHAVTGATFFMSGGRRATWETVMPVWLNEGLAEYVQARIAPTGEHSWKSVHSILTSGKLTPLATLLDSQSGLDEEFFYPSAWALTTFLIQDRPEQLQQYLQLLKTKPFGTDHFASIFGPIGVTEATWQRFIAEQAQSL